MAEMHKTQRQFLANAIANNRVPQAIIFTGENGLGKKQIALEFIDLLNNGKSFGTDLIIIEPQGKEIQIDQIRDLQQSLSYSARQSEFKIVIIDQAHTLNRLAQNCFLKTLEEPKGKTVFILLTAFPEMLLPTIHSRCAVLKFFPDKATKQEAGIAQEIKALLEQNLAGKFAFAEKQKDNASIILLNLLQYLRGLLHQKLKEEKSIEYSFPELKQIIEQTEQMRILCSTTNVNKRLALESLFLSVARAEQESKLACSAERTKKHAPDIFLNL